MLPAGWTLSPAEGGNPVTQLGSPQLEVGAEVMVAMETPEAAAAADYVLIPIYAEGEIPLELLQQVHWQAGLEK